MDSIKICNQLAKEFNFENIEKLFESNQKIQKINGYSGYYKFPFLTDTEIICCLDKNNLFVNYSKLHSKICVGQKFGNKICSQVFINAFNQFLELCGDEIIDTKIWAQQKNNISKCLALIDKKYYIQDTTNSKSPVSGVYLPLSFLHHFLNAFDLKYRAQVADMMNMIGLNSLFSNDENKTTTQIVQTITNNNYEELTSQIKELQIKYEAEHAKFIKENQQRVKYEIECKNMNEKYNKYFDETEDYRRIANMYESEARRLKSIIVDKNREIEQLKENNEHLKKQNKNLTNRLNELCEERYDYRIKIAQEKAEEIDNYKKTITRTNEFVSEIMQFVEPINKMISGNRCNTNKNKLNKFMTDNNIKMPKSYEVYNPDYLTENKQYTNKKTKYETQLKDIQNIDKLKEELNEHLINGFNSLTEEQQLELIDVEEYNNAVNKAKKNKKKIPQKHSFINVSAWKLYCDYEEYFTEYYILYDRISKIDTNEEHIKNKLANLSEPIEYTTHYPKKDIQYKMRNIDSYILEMKPIINFIRDKTEYDESRESDN